jgi:hypothetical protein
MIRILRISFLVFSCCITQSSNAQSLPKPDSLRIILKKGLHYLAATQQDETINGYQFAGEWPSFMSMRTAFMLLAKPEDTYDSNCFSIAAVCNSLSTIYLNDTSLKEIPIMLDKAIPRLLSYYNGASFNFWPLLPPSGRLYLFHSNQPDRLVRRPVQFSLMNPYIRKAANIMNDNDDTAQGYLALWNYNTIKQQKRRSTDSNLILPKFNQLFEPFRDTNRLTAHYYNVIARDKRSSGAYLTWRGAEGMFPTWNIPRLLINNFLFLSPLSSVYPYAYKPYMPYNANDADAIVNANVLTLLATANDLGSSAGVESASAFITRKIKNKKWSRAGVYYPNKYHLHAATLKAWNKGISRLDTASKLLIQHLKVSQMSDGSYHSRPIVNHKDILQSTAYAFYAMVSYHHPFDPELKVRIDNALAYLLAHMYSDATEICWEGGVFFSGGTVIRNTLVWKSDAYTTALILEGISMYLKNYTE